MSQMDRMPVIKGERRPKSNRKLLFFLIVFFLIVLTILFFNSSLSKIDMIEVSENLRYTSEEEIGQALGIAIGNQFFSVSAAELERRIKEIPSVQSAAVSKKFPGKISIEIREYPEVAYIVDSDGSLQLLLANGLAVSLKDHIPLVNRPILTGWGDKQVMIIELSKMLSTIPDELLSDVSEIKPDPSKSYPDKIKIFTRSHFEVSTTISYLPSKIENMSAIINDNEPGKITMLEADYYTPHILTESESEQPVN